MDSSQVQLCGIRQEVKNAREQLLEVIAQTDDILLQQNPRIQADYALKIGVWENELLKAQIEARRAKRKHALAQAAVNRGEEANNNAIEAQLDKEFEEWEALLEIKLAEYADALERRTSTVPMKQKDVKELKALYRKISKRLHPDVCTCNSDKAANFFVLAQRAYELGDIDMLQSIEVATREFEHADNLDAMNQSELELELTMVQAQLNVAQEKLEKVKAEKPYCLGALLKDPDWICAQVAELKAQIKEAQDVCEEYAVRLQTLLGGEK